MALAVLALTLSACDSREPADAQSAAAIPAPSVPGSSAEADAKLDAWFAARYQEELDFSPIQRTMMGDKKDYDRIDDGSEAAEDAQLAWRAGTVRELQATFDPARLGPEARSSREVWIYQAEREAAEAKYRRNRYVFTQMQGLQGYLPTFLINSHRVDEPADMEAWIARVGGIARLIDQSIERARLNAEGGVRPPRFAYEGVITEAKAVVRGAPFAGEGDSALFADAKSEITALEKAGKIDAARAEALRSAVGQALQEQLRPAYDRLIAFAESELPLASPQAQGVHSLPDGAGYYATRLETSTTTRMSAEEIHRFGLSEVRRLHAGMEAVRERIGFKGSLQELFRHMREDDAFFFPDSDAGREAYLQTARDNLAFIDERLPQYFGLLPKAPLEVRRVEAFREQPGAAQHYMPGTPDGSRAGIYYTHLADMRSMPKHQIEVIAYHEGNPGHHMQISIAQELTGIPTFRTQAGFTAYSEGWGLYAELLAKEMGAYQDPYSEMGRLSNELWRAIRLVVDTGIHAKGWGEEQAVEYFTANSPSAAGAIRSEVRRYIVWPGQATAYKIGMQKILDLRESARAELGEAFDIRAFHDTVLGGGALPLA
ncbi:MAG: DUF885 domain-containing protein, partial [Gammaproteobacteria bacterium]